MDDPLALTRLNYDNVGSIELLNLSDYSLANLFSVSSVGLRNIQWSPDGEYLSYLQSELTSHDVTLVTYHLASETISEVVTMNGLYYFDWSPDGEKVVFANDLLEPPFSQQSYIASINCDSTSNQCELVNQLVIPGIGKAVWTPDSEYLTRVETSDSTNSTVIAIRTPEGAMVKIIKLEGLLPGVKHIHDLTWSPDGSFLSFSATIGSINSIYLLDINNQSVLNLSNNTNPAINYYYLEWVKAGR